MGSGASNQNQVQSYESDPKPPQAKEKHVQNSAHKANTHDDIPQQGKSVKNRNFKKSVDNTPVHQTLIESIDSTQTETKSASKLPVTELQKENSNADVLHQKIQQLETELAANGSKNLDLLEKIQVLEEQLEVHTQQPETQNKSESIQETLHAKDQYILKLEKDSLVAQEEANKLRLRLKKRIKRLTNQLHEARQEASITQMELKAEISQLNEKLKGTHGKKSPPSVDPEHIGTEDDGGHSKIIVELSNQLSEQSERISDLLNQVSQKDKRIQELEAMIDKTDESSANKFTSSQSRNNHPSRTLPSTATDRLQSSRGQRPFHQTDPEKNNDNIKGSTQPRKNTGNPQPLERQSTALSDSDSDWEVDSIPSHTRSAPTRSRVKSALSVSNSDSHKGSLVTLNGDDDSMLDKISTSPSAPFSDKKQVQKKSSLKAHLEKSRNEKQMNSLMGPSLAFVSKTDQFSDTSCEPTPRYPNSRFASHLRVKAVKPINP